MNNESEPRIQTTAKTLEIVESLLSFESAGVSELADEVDMTKSTVHHHLQTLEQYEYVVNDGGKYRLGLQFLDIGDRVRSNMTLFKIARPEIQELAEQTGELAHLLVMEHGRGVILLQSKGQDAVHVDTHVGKRVHLHQTALGKAVLANLSPGQQNDIIERHGLPARTENTITSLDRLRDEFGPIKKQGYAVDRGEWNEQLRCIAAPIKEDGDAIGAISVSVPYERVHSDEVDESLVDAVKSAVNVVEIKGSYH
jgi:IclR family transcriptional regulator, acetate operon repressor